MAGPNSAISSVDGSLCFQDGVNSLKAPTVQSAQNPNGLKRSELAWLTNGTVRDGGITPRPGWKLKGKIADNLFPYQGGYMYQPVQADPYLILSIGGMLYKVEPDIGVQNLTIQSTVESVPTAGPWTVKVKHVDSYMEFQVRPGQKYPIDPATVPAGFPMPGGLFTRYAMWLDPFIVPAIGGEVVVNCPHPLSPLIKTLPSMETRIYWVGGPWGPAPNPPY